MAIQRVFVLGAGLMGSGIAQVCAQADYQVDLFDIAPQALDKAMQAIRRSVGKLVEKGVLHEAPDRIVSRVSPRDDDSAARSADLLIEAVPEDLDLKRASFARLDGLAPPHALVATNTSALPVTDLAASTGRPGRVLGLHFFSPVPLMQAVEVVRGLATSEDTFLAGIDFVESLGKVPIRVQRDIPGFLLNRINLPSTLEAIRLVEAGVGSVQDIDEGVKLAFGRKMGIFETGDMVGLDVTFGALKAIYEETRDPRWAPPTLLARKVRAGHLGRKTGRGWYEYDVEGNRKPAKS